MRIYAFICDVEDGGCGHSWDKELDPKEKIKSTCPNCKKRKPVRQNWEANNTYCGVVQEPSTIGQLAERNTKNMGRYELDSKHAADDARNEKTKKALGIDKQKQPWYGTMDSDTKKRLFSGTKLEQAEKQTKYIMEGK